MKKKKSLLACLAGTFLIASVLVGCSQSEAPTTPAAETVQETVAVTTEEAVQETAEPTVATADAVMEKTFELSYLPVQLTGEYVQHLEHQNLTEGGRTVDVFTMVKDEVQLELFRFYFNDRWTGNYLGALTVDGVEIPVTLSVPEYTEDMFVNDGSRAIYYELMENLNSVIMAIQNDDRFSSEEKVAVETEEKQISYWNFSLPADMEPEESTEDGKYQITFYGTVNGMRYKLYSVAVGGVPLRSVLGTYMVNGVPEVVSVESEELPLTDGWPEGSVLELYKMMESINDVIQTIMKSEGFTEQVLEAP